MERHGKLHRHLLKQMGLPSKLQAASTRPMPARLATGSRRSGRRIPKARSRSTLPASPTSHLRGCAPCLRCRSPRVPRKSGSWASCPPSTRLSIPPASRRSSTCAERCASSRSRGSSLSA